MYSLEITPEAMDRAERVIPAGQPVFMLNLLRFRDRAQYGPGFAASACSGREALYERYVPAFRRLIGDLPVKRVFAAPMLAGLVAPEGEAWDAVALNEYGDFATFRRIVDTEVYRREAQPHRLAALADFRLFALGAFG